MYSTSEGIGRDRGQEAMAEREGFEPPIPFQVCRFSRPEPSTTRPPLRIYYSSFTTGRGYFTGKNGVSFLMQALQLWQTGLYSGFQDRLFQPAHPFLRVRIRNSYQDKKLAAGKMGGGHLRSGCTFLTPSALYPAPYSRTLGRGGAGIIYRGRRGILGKGKVCRRAALRGVLFREKMDYGS